MFQYLPRVLLGAMVGGGMLGNSGIVAAMEEDGRDYGTTHVAEKNHVVTRVVHQFPRPTWLENIAALSTGHLLTGTLGSHAELHLINPETNTATLLHNFTQQNSVFGFRELEPDVWAVVSSNYSTTTGAEHGGSVLWRVDLRERVKNIDEGSSDVVKVDKMIDLKDAGVSNGLAVVNPRTVLIADSIKGNIGRIVLPASEGEKAKYDVLIEDATVQIGNTNPDVPLGVNGLAYHAPYLYFSNCNRGLVARVAIDAETAAPSSAVEVVSDDVPVPDDLVVSPDGKTAYVARFWSNTLEKIALPGTEGAGGKPEVVVGAQGSTVVAGPTAVTWGRGKKDQRVLYVSTNGGVGEGDMKFLEGGKIVAVYLDGVACEGNGRRGEL
ncbi:hypothetical protein DM02DRAFT_682768 [Periconia macrospinosa]|uniref:Uncharacterized protein n=1 Tax=Periconia macrospinosa TaxID=97972 RepID=A0A2V1E5T1_9PLEO|nr:hypothetical protein DM02DRAFT_682768 [Periconia macrospinosa]